MENTPAIRVLGAFITAVLAVGLVGLALTPALDSGAARGILRLASLFVTVTGMVLAIIWSLTALTYSVRFHLNRSAKATSN